MTAAYKAEGWKLKIWYDFTIEDVEDEFLNGCVIEETTQEVVSHNIVCKRDM